MQSIEESSFWLATRAKGAQVQSLDEDLETDIAIIGGGFTGLWTAHYLKELNPSAEVVLLEQGVLGYGGSGRNAGMISSCLDHTHSLAIQHFGREEAAKLADIGKRNIDELAVFAADCDFERNGQLFVALTEAHLEFCQMQVDVANELGLSGARILSKEETYAEVHSPLYKGSCFVSGSGILNPVKLLDKIRMQAEAKGVRFFERTKVTNILAGNIQTTKAKVKAKKVVLATDSYSHHLFPGLLQYYIPLYDYISVSEPLSAEQLESIGWANRQGVIDCRSFFNYYRLTSDNRILWGTSEAKYFGNNKVDESCDHSESHYEALAESFKKHFPQLSNLRFEYRWGGPIASTTRLTPFFGTLEGGSVVYALGYTGHGILSTRVAGNVLAHMALAKNDDLLSLSMVQHKPFPYPPEPFRTLSVNMVSSSLRDVDEGKAPNLLLRLLDAFGIGFSS